MDGLETLKAIRRQLGRELPVIVATAYDHSAIEEDFLRAGADAFIVKPLFKSKILRVLRLFLPSSQPLEPSSREGKNAAPLSGKRLLLVEDNEINREIAVELLNMQGIQVDAAENGEQALRAFASSPPGTFDAILMDIQMPVMNGYEATAAIRSLNREDAAVIPIFALTADAFATDVAKARSVGMNDHIAKPVELGRLLETLRRWLG